MFSNTYPSETYLKLEILYGLDVRFYTKVLKSKLSSFTALIKWHDNLVDFYSNKTEQIHRHELIVTYWALISIVAYRSLQFMRNSNF